MEKFSEHISDISKAVLVFGFFDGIHIGHKTVINSAVKYAQKNGLKTVLLTFSASPAEYFSDNSYKYIYPREYNYDLIGKLGIDYIVEEDFASIVNLSADDYLKKITEIYSPIAIFTGFNYTFGAKRTGNSEFLEQSQTKYNYEYFSIQPQIYDNDIVSSTRIKKLLNLGDVENSNILLGEEFSICSTVIKGQQLGRKLGYPTANMEYPKNIVKLPYGVYKAKTLDRTAMLNWGVKPTIGGNKEVLEVHILDFDGDLYGKNLKVNFVKKIRDEKKFSGLDELKLQIKKDAEECLK